MMRLALFDMDGTIFQSQLDWPMIREKLNIAKDKSILKEIYGKHDPESLEKNRILENFEKENSAKAEPRPGVSEFLESLNRHHVKTALITNNSAENTSYLLQKYNFSFDMVITRETRLWKPAPDPLIFVMRRMRIKADETVSIGDSSYDIQASQKAGIQAIFIFKGPHIQEQEGIRYFNDFSELMQRLLSADFVDMSTKIM